MRAMVALLVLGLTAGSISAAVATPLKYNLADVSFLSGGTATGSFMFDADTTAFSAINVTTTVNGAFPGTEYDALSTVSGDTSSSSSIFLSSGLYELALFLVGPMTDSGNAIPLAGGSAEFRCSDTTCQIVSAVRGIVAGEVQTTPLSQSIPEPAAITILGSGLLGLAVTKFFGSVRSR